MKLLRWQLLGAALALVGCDSVSTLGPPGELPYAAVTRSCGPADGPAVAIYLVPSPMQSLTPQLPYVRMYVAQPLEALEGRTWKLAGPDAEGGAWYHSSIPEAEIATWGVLTVHSISADSTVEGEAHLTFPSRYVSGSFRATWVPSSQLCG